MNRHHRARAALRLALAVALVALGLAAGGLVALLRGSHDDTAASRGAPLARGYRYADGMRGSYRNPSSPTNWINERLPDDVALNAEEALAAAASIAQQAAAPTGVYLNTDRYSSRVYVLPADAPLTPVYLRTSQATGDKKALAAVAAAGVPIPPGYVAPSDSDAVAVFYQPGLDREWELWRLERVDPATNPLHASWEFQDGGRMSLVSMNPGHWVDRWNGAPYPEVPPAGSAAFETYELSTWGVTAAKIPVGETTITTEDIRAGVIRHAIRFAALPDTIAPGKRWPANGYDGYKAGAALQEGMRFRFPAGSRPPRDLTRVGRMVYVAIRDYGMILSDRAGSVAFYSEPNAEPLLGTSRSQVLAGEPWERLQLLATGADADPNPRG